MASPLCHHKPLLIFTTHNLQILIGNPVVLGNCVYSNKVTKPVSILRDLRIPLGNFHLYSASSGTVLCWLQRGTYYTPQKVSITVWILKTFVEWMRHVYRDRLFHRAGSVKDPVERFDPKASETLQSLRIGTQMCLHQSWPWLSNWRILKLMYP